MSDGVAVRASGVHVTLSGAPIIQHVDLTVRDGEVVALLGANGSGKSTLVRAALGLNPLLRGEVSLFGTPLGKFRECHRVGFVPQRATVLSTMEFTASRSVTLHAKAMASPPAVRISVATLSACSVPSR